MESYLIWWIYIWNRTIKVKEVSKIAENVLWKSVVLFVASEMFECVWASEISNSDPLA
jgi:hypothetical protein